MIHVEDAKYVKHFALHIYFDDQTDRIVDLKHSLDGPVFEPLKDLDYFKQFTIDPEIRTLVWPNGADFSPDYLKYLESVLQP